ncbi:SET domain-containing protein, partial [Polyplosphaeria fusca]
LIEILSSSTHGQGIYAKVDLKKGQRILEEIPLLAEPKDTSFQGILSSFNSLSTNDQSEFLNFHAHASGHVRWKAYRDFGIAWAQLPEHVRKVVSTYETNAFDDYGVARIATRINHSCVPNTEIYLHDVNELSNSKKIMQLNAIRDIKAGEELFFAYTGTMFVGTKERQKSIQNWGFQCACEACQDTDEAKAADTLR